MGVQGLWSLLGPAARPTQLESLRQKKIAVDASIWIHQFMRTMRDREGNALKNGHLLGFFRRLCKLLFYDIKPVFVFDGGAPSLKRNTIRERRKRREGVKVNLRATAKKILSAQVKSRVLLEQERKQRGESIKTNAEDENFVYAEELEKTSEVFRKSKKLDQYELPEIDSKSAYSKLDPRLATTEELQNFVDEFNVSELDIDSETFKSLPPEVQYEVLQDLKNKSRQTSWARLDEMVRGSKTAMDFSKHQIKLLKHRNTMMQRVIRMHTVAGREAVVAPTRIAGERGRQYVLYKNENLDEGLGWKLPGLSAEQPVILDHPDDHPEPKLEVLDTSAPKPKEDKVKAAVASNPKLVALLSGFMSDDDEEENYENEDEDVMEQIIGEEDNEPPFPINVNSAKEVYEEEPTLMNDIRAYMDDEEDDNAINQVISRIYHDDDKSKALNLSNEEEEDNTMSLTSGDFINLWKSRMPDAFLYLHSFNDEHAKLLQNAVYDKNISQLENDLRSIRKQFGKTNEGDELALESLHFHESFLESVIAWKNKNVDDRRELSAGDFGEVVMEEKKAPQIALDIETVPITCGNKTTSEIIDDDENDKDIQFSSNSVADHNEDIILSDDDEAIQFTSNLIVDNDENIVLSDDDDEDIHFLPIKPASNRQSPSLEENKNNVSHPVKIDIRQSRLITDQSSSQHINEGCSSGSEAKDSKLKGVIEASMDDALSSEANVEKVKAIEKKDEVSNIVEESVDLEIDPQTIQNNNGAAVVDRGYNSEDELEDNIHGEEDEYARFVSDIASKHLEEVRNDLYHDMKELNKQQRKDMGNSDDITDQMVQDIQELLKLFGIPFIVSPMEAEAQCAELESLNLIDGTITDDSDVFLFGASRVYKNMFNQQRFVECYMSQDIEREMLLSRKTLIQLAFLLGSDYTEGIPGVGPVAAMEILSEFSSSKVNEESGKEEEDDTVEGPLKRFKEWYDSGVDTTPFQRKFRKGHKDIDIPDDFPNPLVQAAYYHPTVDQSTQKFDWGQPQLDSLRIFLTEAFGWTEEKADQVLLPVLREMNSKKTSGEQQIIGNYFNVSGTVSSTTNNTNNGQSSQKHSSKRVRSIVEKWRKQKKSKA